MSPGGGRGRAGASVVVALFALAGGAAGATASEEPLPNPLTLEQALAFAETGHPDLTLARARLDAGGARLDQARALTGVSVSLELTGQASSPSTETGFDLVNDSRGRLLLQKRLYDFGYSDASRAAAGGELAGREHAYLDARQGRRLEIMARYFDVLLADLRYAADDEAMAHAYVNFDRARDRHRVGQISDIELLEYEHRYQEVRLRRTESQKRQVSSRQRLGHALNRPQARPADLAVPELPGNHRAPPEFDPLLEKALAQNPGLQALRAEAQGARARVQAERARFNPVVSAEVEAARWAREFPTRDEFRAGLSLRVPIFDGGEIKSAVRAAEAALAEREAQLRRGELDLRQNLLEAVQELETLKVAREAVRVHAAYRDLYLDRSRALYELEVRTDLGDAMARQTEVQWQAAQIEFRLALAWARIEALTGTLTGEPPEGGPATQETKP